MKRLLSLLLVMCCLLMSLFTTTVVAAETTATNGDWEYSVDSGIATVTGYNGKDPHITIPNTIDGYVVTSIGAKAFQDKTFLKSVTFPANLQKIGNYAFSGCIGLTSITLPEKLTSLGFFAFKNCTNLTTITVDSAKLNNFGWNNSYDSYGEPFCNAGIATNGVIVEFTENCTVVPNRMFWSEENSVDAPNIKEVVISDSVTTIGEYAFANISTIEKVSFGRNVASIGARAFSNCANLKAVEFPEALTSIGVYAFSGCVDLTTVTLPEKLTSLGFFAFKNCTNLTTITVDSAKLNNFGWNNSYDSYGEPFCNAGIATNGVTVEFTENCTVVPNRMFWSEENSGDAPDIKEVVISDSVTTIGEYAFANISTIEKVSFGRNVASIGAKAFSNCANLKAVEFPEALTSIGVYAFSGCVDLTTVTLPEKLTSLGFFAFKNCTNLTTITVDSAKLNNFGWNNSYNSYGEPFCNAGIATNGVIVEFTENCTVVPNRMFWSEENSGDAPNIKEVVISDSVITIGEYAFTNLTDLDTLHIGYRVNNIKKSAFYGCTSLSNVIYNDCIHRWQEIAVQSSNEPLFNATLTTRACNPFTDVSRDSFYYDPVMWAYENGITSGTSATTFGPTTACNRAQVVTFLWRAAGSPAPAVTDNPFEDVEESDYYYNAVLWAVEKGITAGVDATQFAPTQSCSRAQVVAFLHRAMGSPQVSAESSPFTDVEAGEWYELPVLWAVENGITAGLTPDTFGVNTVCNRAQVVTFLYRTYVN